ncbi:MAG TPA: hypothetical protein VFM49_21365 [Chloroflexia bacterium]|jgi:hypothetical protein|nr:hypothetical protein [Chloroflexia bacterium]
MTVDVGAILSRTFQVTFKNPVLWLLGFLVAVLSSTSNTNYRFNAADFMPDSVLGSSILALMIVLLVIALFILRAALEGGLIAAAAQGAQDAHPTFREAWQTGRARVWRVLALNLIFAAFVILLVLGLIALALLTVGGAILGGVFAGGAQNLPEASRIAAGIGWALFGLGVIALVAVPVAFILTTVTQLAQRAAVLDDQPVGTAWSTGWRLLRANVANVLLVVLAQIVVNILAGIISAAIIGAIAAPAVLALILGAGQSHTLGYILMVAVLVLIALVISGLIVALPTAWNSTLWTLFYRAVTVPVVGQPGPSARIGGRLPPTVPGAYGS